MKINTLRYALTITITLVSSSTPICAQRCEEEGTSAMAADAMCPNGFCSKSYIACESKSGFRRQCGSESTKPSDDSGRLRSILSSSIFDEILKHRNDSRCPGKGFYNYNSFIAAATAFGGFGTTGNEDTRKREIAAFLAQTSHETSGGWATAPDGPYSWGYCFVNETNQDDFDYCVPSSNWPCASGKKYYGRGPLQITYNFNYGEAGKGIGVDLINNPDLVSVVPILSFTTALWFWMTPQGNRPSCHDVIIGKWIPSIDDRSAGRLPGYGVITNIINGGIECGTGHDSRVADRIGFYKRMWKLMILRI